RGSRALALSQLIEKRATWSPSSIPPRQLLSAPSQTSGLSGKRFGSRSSQSRPPHSASRAPSPSASGQGGRHIWLASSHHCSPEQGGPPATHPDESAPGAPGSQRSRPLQ